MQLGLSVPKMNAVGADGEEGLVLCSAVEGVETFLQNRAGKALILADGEAFSALVGASRLPRCVTLLWDGDALAPFALPDVSCVLASGGPAVLRAARFFAAVRRLPCALFPTDASLDGAFEIRARVRLSGQEREAALADAKVYCDLSLLQNSLAEGYARLPLARLALFESRAAGLICRRPFGGEAHERAFALLDGVRGELTAQQVVHMNARMRLLEREGAPVGEGRALMQLYASSAQPALLAQRALSAYYYALLRCGVPRRYAVPDYRSRAAAAHIPYADMRIPDGETYAARALMFERVRGELLSEIMRLRAAHAAQLRAVRAFAPTRAPAPDLTKLACLPELAADGLCAVARDFGLMENI